jgi:tetratricopeptide (TPR) repeat protein
MILPFENMQYLWLLLLLPVIVLVYFYAVHKRKLVAKKIGDSFLVNELTANYDKKSYAKKFILLFFALMLVLLSIANFRTKTGVETITRNGIDVMIALDVSKSMLAKDVQPNRLERAKQVLSKLIDKLSNDRIGIIIFAGRAYLQMPLTGDHSASKMYLNAATPDAVPTQGTVIGDALKMSYAAFNTKEKKYKAVILLSDGEDHDEDAITVAEEMAEQGIVIHTVGIGSAEGANILDAITGEEKKDKDGNIVVTKLNEEELADIATSGNGTYQLYTNTDAVVNNLYKQLSTMDKRNVEDKSSINYKSWFQVLLGLAFLFLIVEQLISEAKKKTMKSKKYITTALFLFFTITSIAQADKAAVKSGNEAYKKSDFEKAITQYLEATKANDKNTTAQFNLGNALYKADKKEDAIIAYDKVAADATNAIEKSNALYNKGVVMQKDKQLQDCIDAYKKALLQDATNADARHNLQLALQQQKQQKEEQKKEKEKKQDKQNNDNKKDEKKPKEQQSNISKNDAEQKLKALEQREKELQDKMHKTGNAKNNNAEKDW